MTALDSWLIEATRHLAKDSIAQVRTEIQDHYQSALDAAISTGASADEADRLALANLGNAKTANRQYRRVLLTSAEETMLRQGNREAKAVCSRPWLKRLSLAVAAATLALAITLFVTGHIGVARDVLLAGMGISPFLAAQFLPLYTRSRGFVFRCFKWIAMTGAVVWILGPDTLQWSWLLFACLWPLAWTEWNRTSIRRKLPIARWPKHLYL